MVIRFFRLAAIAILAATWSMTANMAVAEEEQASPTAPAKRLLIDYDSSSSMWGELADKSRKYEAGRTALSNFLESEFGEREIAFRAYGHRHKADCRDSELVVPFSNLSTAKSKIDEAVSAIKPKGKTPITYSLRESLKDFDGQPGDILLISDGIETCDMDPCDLMREWKDSKVNIRVHVVGVGLNDLERQAMACIADVSGGKYFDAESADGFAEALNNAGEAIEAPVAEALPEGEPDPAPSEQGFALRIVANDDQGRSYIVKGKLFKENEEGSEEPLSPIGDVGSHQRNVLEDAGNYVIEVGPVLQDGTIFKPVRQTFSIDAPGEVTANVIVSRPAIVTAEFSQEGEEHKGSFVTAYQDGKKAFGFRSFDEILARPGAYEFRAQPNADNELSLTETLPEGEHTVLQFDLVTTIKFSTRFVLPNGEKIKRASELWRDGERLYKVFSGNPTTVRPGIYELRADDQNNPLTPTQVEIKNDGETIEVPLDAGWVTIKYAPSEKDYVRKPTSATLESLDRGGSSYARVDKPLAVTPGRYKITHHSSVGFCDPVEVEVASNQTVDAVLTPKPLGEIVVTYAPSENYLKKPDRASVYPLDDQPMLNGFMRPGVAKKFLPGRYKVEAWSYAGDIAPQEIVVNAHETTNVILKLRAEE